LAPERLLDEARAWAAEIAEKSPTALRFLKYSFNVDTEHQGAVGALAMSALEVFNRTPGGLEGARAFSEKRPPDFSKELE